MVAAALILLKATTLVFASPDGLGNGVKFVSSKFSSQESIRSDTCTTYFCFVFFAGRNELEIDCRF